MDAGGGIESGGEGEHGAIRVRTAHLADAPAIAAIHVCAWERAYRGMVPDAEIDRRTLAWRTSMWKEILNGTVDDRRPWVAVAERDGATIGFVSLGAARDGSIEITALYVDPDAWRDRAGTALMAAALDQATGRGCAGVTLWVLEPNLRARAFYAGCGFADDGGRRTEGDGWPVELRLRRAP